MKKLLLGATGLAMAFSAPTFAEDGWYAKAGAGLGSFTTMDIVGASTQSEVEGDGDARFMIGGGYGFSNGWRLDVDLMDRYADTGALDNTIGTSDIQNVALMGNAIYDFNRGGRFQPYAGLGLGLANTNFSAQFEPLSTINEDETSLAAQALFGIGVGLTERLTADLGYRFYGGPDVSFSLNNERVELLDTNSHDVLFGLRYAFGAKKAAPAPAPAPAPAAAPPQAPAAQAPVAVVCEDVPFIVYFEWDRSDLTDQSRTVISNAADRAEVCDITRVSIEGHADRSGAAAYNVRLSERRARIVRDALITEGVAADLIFVEAKGESEPAVSTQDGVREPLNRRSEVVIRVQ